MRRRKGKTETGRTENGYRIKLTVISKQYFWGERRLETEIKEIIVKTNMLIKLKYLIRTLKRNKLILGVNVIGLTIGLGLCLLLFAYIAHELSYDKHFVDSKRIVRVLNIWTEGNNAEVYPICTRKAYTEVPAQIPEIEASTQLYRGWSTQMMVNNNTIDNLKMHYVDTTFFNVFKIPFIYGSHLSPFKGSSSVILSAATAQKAFGNINPIGKTIEVEKKTYVISAVSADLPNNSHFNYQVLFPMQALNGLSQMQGLEFFTYYKLVSELLPAITNKISTKYKKILDADFEEFNVQFSVLVEPLEEIHLFTKAAFDLSPQGDTSRIWFVAAIALIVLFIAVFNCINLFIAFSRNRLTEIGVKKAIGASSRTITLQLLSEALLINSLALVFAILLAYILIPLFGEVIQRQITLTSLFSGLGIVLVFTTILLSTLASGLYPAYLLSKYNSVSILKGKSKNGKSSDWLSGTLMSVQFAIAVLLLFALLNINNQVDFLKTKHLGFNAENVMVFSDFDRATYKHRQALKHDLIAIPEISQVGFSAHRMGGGCSGQGIKLWGDTKEMSINEYRVQPGFCETFELQLLWGRFYNENDLEKENVVIINKTAANKLGVNDYNSRFVNLFGSKTEVIGVVNDFAYEGSAHKVRPIMLTAYSSFFRNISLRISHSQTNLVKQKITDVIAKYSPAYMPKIKYTAQQFSAKYKEEERTAKIVGFGGVVAIFISLMGVFAITIFNLQKRIKEYGVRKVLGASTQSLSGLVIIKMFKWISVSLLVALPLGAILINRWFQNYPAHSAFSFVDFAIAATIPLLLALIIISWHSIAAARQNPVEALRYE